MLTNKPVVIDKFDPRISDPEVAFLNMVAGISEGTKIVVQADGKKVTLDPG